MSSVGVQLQTADNKNAYPRPYFRIGDILESTNPNNPEDDGYIGTWELYGKGRVTVCIDTEDSNFNIVNKEIGESENVLTIDKIPAHYHTLYGNTNVYSSAGSGYWHNQSAIEGYSNGERKELYFNTLGTNETGGGKAHNNIQKSIVVYRWRRIA